MIQDWLGLAGKYAAITGATGGIGRATAEVLAALDPKLAEDPALAQARSALALALDAPEPSELDGLRATVAANPGDMDAELALANGIFASGDRDGAATLLLDMVTRDRTWNEGAARTRLLQIFEAIGLEDPWVASTRRKLSTVLFG